MPDFRPRLIYGLNALKGFGYVGDHGEYPGMRRSERGGPSLVIDTYGGVYSITRQAIINDDSGELLNRNPSGHGVRGRQLRRGGARRADRVEPDRLRRRGVLQRHPRQPDDERAVGGRARRRDHVHGVDVRRLRLPHHDQGRDPRREVGRHGDDRAPDHQLDRDRHDGRTRARPGVGSKIMDKGVINPLQGILRRRDRPRGVPVGPERLVRLRDPATCRRSRSAS
jgi:hypothetical protein